MYLFVTKTPPLPYSKPDENIQYLVGHFAGFRRGMLQQGEKAITDGKICHFSIIVAGYSHCPCIRRGLSDGYHYSSKYATKLKAAYNSNPEVLGEYRKFLHYLQHSGDMAWKLAYQPNSGKK